MTVDDLAPIEYGGRAASIRLAVHELGLDALAVHNPLNVRWLTGFGGSNAAVAVLPERLVLVTDGRYRERAVFETGQAGLDVEVLTGFTQSEQADLFANEFSGCESIGADAKHLSHARWNSLASVLPIVAADDIIEDCRRVKDSGELARIRMACVAADLALADVAPLIGSGMTERDVARELEYRMRLHGADGPSYDTIVASGPHHGSRPHHSSSDRLIVEGDTLIIDVGGLVDGYHSDMTRSFTIGDPNDQQDEIYQLLLVAQQAGLDAVSAGVAAADIDTACRSVITDAGYGDWFLHSTGHGVGLQIHEEPFESQTSIAELRAGDVVTIEPGLYRVGFGGFRIEDLVEVTDTGCRILTETPKESPCLPSQRMT